MQVKQIRNIAIVAHVDHGKTTLVDAMLKQSGTFRDNQEVADRVLDSNELEREKGITIMAKNTAVTWNGVKINIVDTPGHADFGGEVERILKMVNGVILLVDAAEGPLPQTKFVLRKSLQLGYKPIVVINKIDRPDARPDDVLNEVFDLFVSLNASDEQLDFTTLYAIGLNGTVGFSPDDLKEDLHLLFESIITQITPPETDATKPFKMLVSNIEWNDYVGRIAIGRVEQGNVKINQNITLVSSNGEIKDRSRATKLFTFNGLKRELVEFSQTGDIIALAGYQEVSIGDTITDSKDLKPIEFVNIDQPTMAMFFRVNDSPFAGLEGDYVTSNFLKDRLEKETRNNVGIKVLPTDNPDVFRVAGRGELQLAILIESMRREGYEFAVSKPEVLMHEVDGKTHEPIEEVVIDVHQDFSNKVIDNLQRRKGLLQSMNQEGDNHRLLFHVPSRGLIGFRGELFTETRGTGLMHQQFLEYQSYKGEIPGRSRGAIVALESGDATSYALENLKDRGQFFVEPGHSVYQGMVVGVQNRGGDLVANLTKKKNLTNHRASQTADSVKLSVARKMSLEEHIEFLDNDELLEVTPKKLRLRKLYLDENKRKRYEKQLNAL